MIVRYCIAMKKIGFLLLGLTLVIVTGCDFFRILAGRPTSSEIEEIRAEIRRVEKARQDSLEIVRQERVRDSLVRADSIAALDSIVKNAGPLLTPEKFHGLVSGDFNTRYCIIVGSFKTKSNAVGFLKKVRQRGYEAGMYTFKSGWYAIGVCPSDHIRQIQRSLKSISEDGFFPRGTWVLVNDSVCTK